METKIYIIKSSSNYISFSTSKVEYFSFSKIDAEYKAWKLQKEQNKLYQNNPFSIYGERNHFEVIEVPYLKVEIDRDYKKFIEEKKKEINESISELEKCKNKDIIKIEKLKEQLKLY